MAGVSIAFMAKLKKLKIEDPVPAADEEDQETLAAIDEGIHDADSGRTVSSERARARLSTWISDSVTHKER